MQGREKLCGKSTSIGICISRTGRAGVPPCAALVEAVAKLLDLDKFGLKKWLDASKGDTTVEQVQSELRIPSAVIQDAFLLLAKAWDTTNTGEVVKDAKAALLLTKEANDKLDAQLKVTEEEGVKFLSAHKAITAKAKKQNKQKSIVLQEMDDEEATRFLKSPAPKTKVSAQDASR